MPATTRSEGPDIGRWFAIFFQLALLGCAPPGAPTSSVAFDTAQVVEEVETAVWRFHAADTARDAEGVISLLWPEFSMLGDGARLGFTEAAAGSRQFMEGLAIFETDWSSLEVIPLARDVAVASFLFRDSIVSKSGDVIRTRGPTTLVWERRDGEWRVRYADADHYPVQP